MRMSTALPNYPHRSAISHPSLINQIEQQNPTVLHNNIIVNINEQTNINNFLSLDTTEQKEHSFGGPLKDSKPPAPVSNDKTNQQIQAFSQVRTKKPSTGMIQGKRFDQNQTSQAKQNSQISLNKTVANQMSLPISKIEHSAPSPTFPPQQAQSRQSQAATIVNGIQGNLNKGDQSKSTKGTMISRKLLEQAKEYKKQKATPKAIPQKQIVEKGDLMRNYAQLRRNSEGQSLSRQRNQSKPVKESGTKSGRSMDRKKSQSLSRQQKKVVSEARYRTQVEKGGQVRKNEIFDKENSNFSNIDPHNSRIQTKKKLSVPLDVQKPSMAVPEPLRRKNEVMSASSMSQRSANHPKIINQHQSQTHHDTTNSIADYLTKNFFLNSKQLLRHLSPGRTEQEIHFVDNPDQMISEIRSSGRQTLKFNSNSKRTNEGKVSGMSQRTKKQRGKSKSIVPIQNWIGRSGQKRNNSHSTHRQVNSNVKASTLHPELISPSALVQDTKVSTRQQLIKELEQRIPKSRSSGQYKKDDFSIPSNQVKSKVQTVDKLIKENLKQNRKKIQEEEHRRQEAELLKQQKFGNLAQLNQEVRLNNVPRLRNDGSGEKGINSMANSFHASLINVGNDQSQREPKVRYRSKSCIHQNSSQHQTRCMGNSQPRDQSHSHDRQASQEKDGKRPNYLEEVNLLTQQLERELMSEGIGNKTLQFKRIQQKLSNYPSAKGQKQFQKVNEMADSFEKVKEKQQRSQALINYCINKKREEQMKKSLEQTIELDKQERIKKNLLNLEKYAKKQKRQKTPHQQINKKKEKSRKQKSRCKIEPPVVHHPVLGLSQIFHDPSQTSYKIKDAEDPSLHFHDDGTRNISKIEPSHNRQNSFESSMIEDIQLKQMFSNPVVNPKLSQDPNQISREYNSTRAGAKKLASNTQRHQVSLRVQKKLFLERSAAVTTTDPSRTQTATRVQGRKNQMGEKEIGRGGPTNPLKTGKDDGNGLGAQIGKQVESGEHITFVQNQNNFLSPIDQSQWLSKKHPQIPQRQADSVQFTALRNSLPNTKSLKKGVDRSDRELFIQPSPQSAGLLNQFQYSHLRSAKSKSTKMSKQSPLSQNNMFRMQDFLSKYRQKFRPNMSDAQVMGALHAAASVIQVNLRQIQERRQRQQMSSKRVQKQRLVNQPSDQSQIYIDTDNSNELLYVPMSMLEDKSRRGRSDQRKNLKNSSSQKSQAKKQTVTSSNFQFAIPQKDTSLIRPDLVQGEHKKLISYLPNQISLGNEQPRFSGESGQKQEIIENMNDEEWMGDYDNKIFDSGSMGGREEEGRMSQIVPDYLEEANDEMKKSLLFKNGSSGLTSPPLQVISRQSCSIVPNDYTESAKKQQSGTTVLQQRQAKKQGQRGQQSQVPSQIAEGQKLVIPQKKQKPFSQINIETQALINSSKFEPVKSASKTPQIPGLNLQKLKTKEESGEVVQVEKEVEKCDQESKNQVEEYKDHYHQDSKEVLSQISHQEVTNTLSSYRGIFNRAGIVLPRSARIKVEYGELATNPKLSEQLQEVIAFKEKKGRELLEQSKLNNLITDRTYENNIVNLEKWATTSYDRAMVLLKNKQDSKKKLKAPPSKEQLINEALENKQRLKRIIEGEKISSTSVGGKLSERQSGRLSSSWRGQRQVKGNQSAPANSSGVQGGDGQSEEDPYMNLKGIQKQSDIDLGSGRHQKSRIVELINENSPRSNQFSQKRISSASDCFEEIKIEDIKLNLGVLRLKQEGSRRNEAEKAKDTFSYSKENVHAKNEKIRDHQDLLAARPFIHSRESSQLNQSSEKSDIGESSKRGDRDTEKSLNRSQSYPTILQQLRSDSKELVKKAVLVTPNDEPDCLDQRHTHSQLARDQSGSPKLGLDSDSQVRIINNIKDLRDPHFFTRQLDEDGDIQSESRREESNSRTNNLLIEENTKINLDHQNVDINLSTPERSSKSKAESPSAQKQDQISPIRVEIQGVEINQQKKESVSKQPAQLENLTFPKETPKILTVVSPISVDLKSSFPVSPSSDSQTIDNKIQKGEHSLSSTDSDLTKAINNLNQPLESPPNLLSPKNIFQGVSVPNQQQQEKEELADQLSDWILAQFMLDLKDDLEYLIPRAQIAQTRQQSIKFFDKKGIRTDLFAIERYVDEVLDEVKQNRQEFMEEISKPISKNPLQNLFQMQSAEIGNYEHFQYHMPPVLSLDLYLKLEKRRKESRESRLIPGNPDGLFDFENATTEELEADRVDKNFLAECAHIHNKVLFDCINDSLQQFRPHSKDGAPMPWSRLGIKLKAAEQFTLEEMFELTKHDLFRMAIMQSGTLPRREFVFGGQFDEDLFAEIREKKLATLLCREIVENEPQWLKWEFEEAQTKVDIADMVLESLVIETIEFLNKKQKDKSQSQVMFKELEEMIKSRV